MICNYEVYFERTKKKVSLRSGRSKILSPFDIYSAALMLFHIEEIEKIENLYFRNLKPVIMFQIRQLLEIFGRELIGYYFITEKDEKDKIEKTAKRFTQIAWDFIKQEIKLNNSRIKFPSSFNVHMILAIISWSNRFVHSTYLYNSYIQFFVLKKIGVLFFSTREGIKIYSGRTVKKGRCTNIKITRYESLKTDFENYLKSKRLRKKISVEWMDIDQVGAYIISK